ncbi:spore coat protein [Priestia megaterium]|uniref:spore coat protein n=1 Tax=Priestia megaterium TaxID=1404 RepID=UPI0011A80A60|nr:spore coat protein [Priestia megaterium]
MPSHKRYESREVRKRSKKKHSDHDFKSRFELEEDDHFSHLFESDNNFEVDDNNDAVIEQEPDAFSFVNQDSDELIWIKDSCDVTVTTADTQTAAQTQILLQSAIATITAILTDNVSGQVIVQELLAVANLDQVNKQKILVINSKDVVITATDTDTAANTQLATQTLVSTLTAILVGNVSG